jgi:Inner membrane protein YgaP-like, transmembrane domain
MIYHRIVAGDGPGQEVDMTTNMSKLDRGLRAFVVAPAAIIAALAVGAGSVAGIVLLVIAGIMLATGAVGFCPLYRLLHLSSRGRAPLAH